MSTLTRRTVTLLDLLTLIAATAVGLALARVSIDGIRDRPLARSTKTEAMTHSPFPALTRRALRYRPIRGWPKTRLPGFTKPRLD